MDAVEAVFREWAESGAVPPGERSEPRLEPPTDTGYGLREMALVDPNGNLLPVGSRLRPSTAPD